MGECDCECECAFACEWLSHPQEAKFSYKNVLQVYAAQAGSQLTIEL